MLKTAAIIFGIAFLVSGVLGFVPAAAPKEMLFGIFHVNPAHNGVHLLSGAAALFTGMMSTNAARMYFRVFGVVYALVAALGFYVGNGMLLGLVSNNMADVWLHVAVAAASLALGFLVKDASA